MRLGQLPQGDEESSREMTMSRECQSSSHPREGMGNNGKRWVALRRKHTVQSSCNPVTCTFTSDS
jgi:hypothetical protein